MGYHGSHYPSGINICQLLALPTSFVIVCLATRNFEIRSYCIDSLNPDGNPPQPISGALTTLVEPCVMGFQQALCKGH